MHPDRAVSIPETRLHAWQIGCRPTVAPDVRFPAGRGSVPGRELAPSRRPAFPATTKKRAWSGLPFVMKRTTDSLYYIADLWGTYENWASEPVFSCPVGLVRFGKYDI